MTSDKLRILLISLFSLSNLLKNNLEIIFFVFGFCLIKLAIIFANKKNSNKIKCYLKMLIKNYFKNIHRLSLDYFSIIFVVGLSYQKKKKKKKKKKKTKNLNL